MEACVCPYHPGAGLHISSSMTDLFNIQWIRDSNGDAASITIEEGQGIRITVEGRWYPALQQGETARGSLLVNGEEVGYTVEIDYDAYHAITNFYPELAVIGKLDNSNEYSQILELSSSTTAFSGESATSVTVDDLTVTAYWYPNTFSGELNTIAFKMYQASGGGWCRNYLAFRLDTPLTIEDTQEITIQATRSYSSLNELDTALNEYNPYNFVRCEGIGD